MNKENYWRAKIHTRYLNLKLYNSTRVQHLSIFSKIRENAKKNSFLVLTYFVCPHQCAIYILYIIWELSNPILGSTGSYSLNVEKCNQISFFRIKYVFIICLMWPAFPLFLTRNIRMDNMRTQGTPSAIFVYFELIILINCTHYSIKWVSWQYSLSSLIFSCNKDFKDHNSAIKEFYY